MIKIKITKEDVERYNRAYIREGGLSKGFRKENAELITSIKHMLVSEHGAVKLSAGEKKIADLSALMIAGMGKDADEKAIRRILDKVRKEALVES